jgi:transcriptional regulator with XRE-family HTH domain
MKSSEVGLGLRRARIRAGMSQSKLAGRMGTSQSAIARAESGLTQPTLDFVERFAAATKQPLQMGSLVILAVQPADASESKATRVRRALGDYVFNPWDRNPTPIEQQLLEARGMSREHFEGEESASTSRR